MAPQVNFGFIFNLAAVIELNGIYVWYLNARCFWFGFICLCVCFLTKSQSFIWQLCTLLGQMWLRKQSGSSTNHSPAIPVHVPVSLGKTLNPKLLSMVACCQSCGR